MRDTMIARRAVAALSAEPTCPYCMRKMLSFHGDKWKCLTNNCVADGRDLRNG